jgi:CRP-like cAMP-binding protein
LAHVLLSLADHREGETLLCALPDVTQEFIARMVGTTRSRVNMFLGKFKRMGFIKERGGVMQINPALLHDVSANGMVAREAR